MLEVLEGVLCALELLGACDVYWRQWKIVHNMLWVLQVMRCVLLRTQKAVEGGLCLLEVLQVMRRVLLCMLRAVEGELCLLDVLEAKRCMPLCMLETLEVPEVIRRVLLCMLELWRVSSVYWMRWR